MTFRGVIVFCSLAAAGCAVERPAPTEAPVAAVAAVTPEPARAPAASPPPPDAAVAEVASTAPAPPASPQASIGPAVSPAPEIVATPLSNPAAATTNPPAAASPAVAATRTGPAERPAVVAVPNSPPRSVASQAPASTLDFTSLGARLRTTKAIGVLTKLSVKNQADDLLAQFRDYHQQEGAATLPDLRHSYDMLVLKLLSLVQDGDPPLATDINRSRAAIWDILSDQSKFIDANLMAGASL